MNQVWVISGQSNAVGSGTGVSHGPTPSVQMPQGAAWVTAAEPLSFFDYTGTEGIVGFPLTAGHAYAYWVPGSTVKLTGMGRGSLPIAAWAPKGEAWVLLEAAILSAGPSSVTGFIWFQGESDAVVGTLGRDYAAALRSLIARVRALTQAALPVVIVGLGGVGNPIYHAGYWTIREAQREVATDTDAVWISAEGLPMQSDFHLSADSQRALGKRIAALFVA